MSEISVFTQDGKKKDSVQLPSFTTKALKSRYVVHEVVVAQQANLRQGTSSTKTRAEVSGGGKKPWKQKGTGNARAGSNRSPLWRKGGITFGPKPRSYYTALPQIKKDQSVAIALQLKAEANNLFLVEKLPDSKKTKDFAQFISKISPSKRILLVVENEQAALQKVARNIQSIQWSFSNSLNALAVMQANQIILTSKALEDLKKRLSKDLS